MSELGRQVKYGIAKETTAGTAVAPTNWVNQLSFEVNPQSEYVNNESAYGVIERTNSATVLREWTEGELEAKLTANTGGLVLLGAFGDVSSAANGDASGSVYDHTYTINQDIAGQSLTLVRKDALSTNQFALGRFNEWSLEVSLDDYIRYTTSFLAKKGATTTATAAYTSETEFVAKHFTIKNAATVGGLGAASEVSTVEEFTLNVNPNLETDWETGNNEPYGFTSRGYELNFEMTTRYNDTTFETAYKNGTQLAWEITIANTDVTIGTAANPKYVFTAPKVNITDWSRSEDLDSPITQSLTGTIHYSASEAYALKSVLTNLVTAY